MRRFAWVAALATGLGALSLGGEPSNAQARSSRRGIVKARTTPKRRAVARRAAPPRLKPRPLARRRQRRGPRRVIQLKGDVIEGRVQKPEAFYVLHRTSLSFDGLKLGTRLAPRIRLDLKKPPFSGAR